jgi:phage nucleotide-binding protein
LSTATAEVLRADSLGELSVVGVQEEIPNLNLLVYGDPGVGKTVLAGSAAAVEAMCPVIFIDAEGGTLSLRNKYPDVKKVRVKHFADLSVAYNALRENPGLYRTVVLDSITEIQKYGMYEIMAKTVKEDPERDPDLPGIGEWGKNTEQMRKVIRAFRDLPMNTIFTALARTEKDKKGKVTTQPSLSAKLANEAAGFLDIVVYMYRKVEDEQIVRRILTMATDEITAKDRTDRLPPYLDNPTMQELYTITSET